MAKGKRRRKKFQVRLERGERIAVQVELDRRVYRRVVEIATQEGVSLSRYIALGLHFAFGLPVIDRQGKVRHD